MTCEEARTSMHFHLDGDEHLHVINARVHTASCMHCERHVLDLQETEMRLKELKKYAAPPGLQRRILDAVVGMQQKRPLIARAESEFEQ